MWKVDGAYEVEITDYHELEGKERNGKNGDQSTSRNGIFGGSARIPVSVAGRVSDTAGHYKECFGDEDSRAGYSDWRHCSWPAGDYTGYGIAASSLFGNSPEFWLNLQQMHDLSKARLELSKTIERDVEAYAGA